jgi:predicted acyl esterase
VATAQVATDPGLAFDRIEAMVPMRDGIRLETQVYVPRGAREKLPILLMRTPYGFSPDAKGWSQWLTHPGCRTCSRRTCSCQSVRGRFRSKALRHRPVSRSGGPNSWTGTDAYDTVEWLLSQVSSTAAWG